MEQILWSSGGLIVCSGFCEGGVVHGVKELTSWLWQCVPENSALQGSGRWIEKLRLAWATEKVLGHPLVILSQQPQQHSTAPHSITQHNTTQRANKPRKAFYTLAEHMGIQERKGMPWGRSPLNKAVLGGSQEKGSTWGLCSSTPSTCVV